MDTRDQDQIDTDTKDANQAFGMLFVELRLQNEGPFNRLRAVVRQLQLGGDDAETVLITNRRIDIDPRREEGIEFILSAPKGSYDVVVLEVAEVSLRQGKSRKFKEVVECGAVKLSVPLRIHRDRPVRLVVSVDVGALVLQSDFDSTIKAQVDATPSERVFLTGADQAERFHLSVASLDPTRDTTFTVALAPRALPADTRVVLRLRDSEGLPPLFRDQQVVGPIIEINADAELADATEVTVPYVEQRIAAAGAAPDSIAIMHLDDERREYRELRPTRVDTIGHTVTVRTRSFSTFFACTPGIQIRTPELRSDGWGRVLALSNFSTGYHRRPHLRRSRPGRASGTGGTNRLVKLGMVRVRGCSACVGRNTRARRGLGRGSRAAFVRVYDPQSPTAQADYNTKQAFRAGPSGFH